MTANESAISSMQLLTSKELAKILNVTTKTLERWRGAGEGPCFVRISASNVRYRTQDIETFINRRISINTIPPQDG
ncbi:helix-turn-helix transcriptional regulator [Azospirillum doebereinerae]|uniref:DNA-binding protein n=1 Tax=Azospirillum doebereinerae TaxID=92933 RepID=A0A433IZ94_9PROT|nr:helix-turn-helix domain-containing protein [Azospirillum doebereinerae]RUQ60047.1 DNA-binding protein [Azospirillum doebereinerae]